MAYAEDFERALQVGRPPNIQTLFPNSKALIVSGKVVDRAMRAKGKAIAMAANGRNSFVIRGALRAAQRANAALIIEIAKSEGGQKAYCAVNYWNMARVVDALCNEMGITIPVAIHADHYGMKNDKDLAQALVEIPSMFEAGITSIAIDASHQPNDQNLLANLAVNPKIPAWAGLETEIGEIKGSTGLSTPDEALFLIQGLNAHDIAADWIALNNGTTHGIEASSAGIQVDLTAEVHKVLVPYEVSGAQHGTSGNSSERLREIANQTHTTKANVATALQMISWGLEVNDYGNAQLDADGGFIKVAGEGMTEELWAETVAFADDKGWKKGDYKNLNILLENKLCAQPAEIRERMARRVEDFAYGMMTKVFNAEGTAPLAVEAILAAGSYDLGPKVGRLEDPADWTDEKIVEKAEVAGQRQGRRGQLRRLTAAGGSTRGAPQAHPTQMPVGCAATVVVLSGPRPASGLRAGRTEAAPAAPATCDELSATRAAAGIKRSAALVFGATKVRKLRRAARRRLSSARRRSPGAGTRRPRPLAAATRAGRRGRGGRRRPPPPPPPRRRACRGCDPPRRRRSGPPPSSGRSLAAPRSWPRPPPPCSRTPVTAPGRAGWARARRRWARG